MKQMPTYLTTRMDFLKLAVCGEKKHKLIHNTNRNVLGKMLFGLSSVSKSNSLCILILSMQELGHATPITRRRR